jgi:hypothetical protein
VSKKSRPWTRQQRRAIRRRTEAARGNAIVRLWADALYELEAKLIKAEQQAVDIWINAGP